MNPFLALRLPFQMASLLFVLLLSTVNAVAGGSPEIKPMRLLVLFILLSWLNKFAFALLEHVANGRRDTPVASVEMLHSLGDARVWLQPTLAAGIVIAISLAHTPVALAISLAVALLMPASMTALVASPRALDAVNPVFFVRLIRDFGPWYFVLLAAAAVCVGACYALYEMDGSQFLRFTAAQLVVLMTHALIGAVIFHRRLELSFEPAISPERTAARQQKELDSVRQQALDDFYGAIRAREPARAAAGLTKWLSSAGGARLAVDVEAMIDEASRWPDQRGLATLVRAVVAQSLTARQNALAVRAMELGLTHQPTLALDSADDAAALATLARQGSRRRLGAIVLDNYARTQAGGLLPPELAALRKDLPT